MALRPSSDDTSEEPFTDPFTDPDDYSTILDDDISYDFLSFLAIAQSVNAEFIDMTMHPGLGLAGRGATADIDQALLNRSVALAYKRHVKVGTSPELAFKALATEVLVLQQPRIWQHENIIDLFGIGWDIKVNKEKEVEQILPVLVLENASIFGTLEMFMKDEAAQLQDVVADVEDDPSLVLPDFDYGDCIRICRGIGRALQILHAYSMLATCRNYLDHSRLTEIQT